MSKRQQRIFHPFSNVEVESLAGKEATICMKDNKTWFCVILRVENNTILFQDKLLKKHSHLLEDVYEIILEKEEGNQIC